VFSKLYVLIIPILALTIPIEQQEIIAKCVKVIDGDTILINRGQGNLKIRLGFIDAPEIGQRSFTLNNPIGLKSKQLLESLILNKRVTIRLYGKGKYGRYIGEIFHQGQSINLKMIEHGQAILYKYSSYPTNSHRASYHSVAHIAMNRRVGLWSEVGFMNPSHYRKQKRHKKSP